MNITKTALLLLATLGVACLVGCTKTTSQTVQTNDVTLVEQPGETPEEAADESKIIIE